MGLNEAQKKERSDYLEENLQITECSQRTPYAFISYASDNWKTVFQDVVVPLQRQYGLRVYADKAFDNVNDRWIVPMLRNVRGADMMLVFISQSYIESYACFLELLTAVNSKRPLVFVSLEEDLHLGTTIDQPPIEEGVKNEILNQGSNLSTITNNTSNDIMRAMKSAFTSLSTLLAQDSLAKYDISDAFINFFRDASVNRKSIYDLNALMGSIASVSASVFDKALAAAPQAGPRAAAAPQPKAAAPQVEPAPAPRPQTEAAPVPQPQAVAAQVQTVLRAGPIPIPQLQTMLQAQAPSAPRPQAAAAQAQTAPQAGPAPMPQPQTAAAPTPQPQAAAAAAVQAAPQPMPEQAPADQAARTEETASQEQAEARRKMLEEAARRRLGEEAVRRASEEARRRAAAAPQATQPLQHTADSAAAPRPAAPVTSQKTAENDGSTQANVSLGFGIFSILFLLMMNVLFVPCSIIGTVLSTKVLKSPARRRAITALVLNGLALLIGVFAVLAAM